MVKKWILNASPLILLHKIDFLEKMSALSEEWLIPEAVVREIEKKNLIDSYIKGLSLKSNVIILKRVRVDSTILAWDIGLGESEVLSFALQKKNTGVVLDDLQARKCAQLYNIPLKGSLGIIGWAKKEGIIDTVKPHFERLIRKGIRIEERLMRDILIAFNEL